MIEFNFNKHQNKELHQTLDNFYKTKKKRILEGCLFGGSDCSAPISSHSLSLCWLKLIARNGFITRLKFNPRQAGKQPFGVMEEREGYRTCSTFPGFCDLHDSELFKSIDSISIEDSPQNCLLIAYRSLCHNLQAKHSNIATMLDHHSIFRSPTPSLRDKFTRSEMFFTVHMLKVKMDFDLEIRSPSEKSKFSHLLFKYPHQLPVAGTASFLPYITPTGKALKPKPTDWCQFSVIPQEAGSTVILTYYRSSKSGGLLAKSLSSIIENGFAEIAFKYLLEIADNLAISPDWWDSLESGKQNNIMQRTERGFGINENSTSPKASHFKVNGINMFCKSTPSMLNL